VIYFVALTVAILTENNPLIIRTTRTTTIRERLNKDGFMGCRFRPIIGGNGNKSRGKCRIRRNSMMMPITPIQICHSEHKPFAVIWAGFAKQFDYFDFFSELNFTSFSQSIFPLVQKS